MASVLDRTFRILRASLGARRRRAWRADPAGWPPTERRGDAAPQSREDPELAGLYANLEVPYGADLQTVRDSWKRLLRKYHPDLHGADPERQRIATELVKGLNHAFDQLRRRLEHNPGT